MSRHGVTLDQVRIVKTAMETRGETISHEKVRHELGGTGSYSTIAAHLRTLAAEETQQSVSINDIPKDLAESVASHARQMWQLASSLANTDVEIIRRTTSRNNEVLSEQLQNAIETIKTIECELDSSKSRVSECEAEIAELRQSNSLYEQQLVLRAQKEEERVSMYKEVVNNLTNMLCEQGKKLTGKKNLDN